ncbi:unnamed protein product [Fraxinus pennsylvanica]|uniref:Uncharacterized protein n=1 Tax=Fraxinus pennsylvanica TaxID=56036 RepID=A0AAD1ZXK5_9LAMI|nr:unnamed protein product [Fraxinus pennsylvanica]
MAFSVPTFSTFPSNFFKNTPNTIPSIPQFSYSFAFPNCNNNYISTNKNRKIEFGLLCCSSTSKQRRGGGGGSPPATRKKKKSNSKSSGKSIIDDDFEIEKSGVELLQSPSPSSSEELPYETLPLPKPPAGFVLDDQGRVLVASNKRIATIVDSTNNFPLECIIRRVFRNSRGDECMLLCPVDMPVQILKSVNVEGWSAVSDEEVESILPTAAYTLAKIHMHLVYSGFCYTARGGFCYTEDDIIEFHTDNGQDVDGLPTEGIEIACFHLDGSHYMIYTPSDPLLFVALKDENGALQIADDELLDDPAIISAIDEETEFNALVEEEDALLESLLGKR